MPPGPAATLGTALLLLLLASESAHTVILRAREAAQFLRPRQRRAYQVFEEAKQGHLERECIEELCSQEEAREVFENDPETVSARGGEVCARRLGPRAPSLRRRISGDTVRARTGGSPGVCGKSFSCGAHPDPYQGGGRRGGRAGS
ncbi:hypothetical protein J1605_009326 [Eschrichtius robustus]|uniref:Gla domain-containing protein n=1 Tax=Eschrichtius robustus TaxID=9764 RepID=A0AB34GT44_ESCRO|nr:hypothetical protein J1605_009326 [Eschrichtius robustus]